jgi:hypothetical protein
MDDDRGKVQKNDADEHNASVPPTSKFSTATSMAVRSSVSIDSSHALVSGSAKDCPIETEFLVC